MFVVLAAAPESAQAAPPRGRAHVAPSADRRDPTELISQVMKEIAPYQDEILEAESLVETLSSTARQASNLATGEVEGGAQAWLTAWRADNGARVASLKARSSALQPISETLLRRAVILSPANASELAGLGRGISAAAHDITAQALQLAETADTELGKAAEGDHDAARRLEISVVIGSRTVLECENALLEVGIVSAGREHPQTAIARSVQASNRGVALLFDGWEAALRGGDPNVETLVPQLRAAAKEARDAAALAAPRAKAFKAKVGADPAAAPELKRRVTAMLDTYDASAKVEIELSDVLLRCADAIEASKSLDSLGGVVAGTSELMERRMALQRARQAALGG